MNGKVSAVIGAEANRPHGHIAVGPERRAEATFVDVGNGRLQYWAYDRGEIDAAGARALAAELKLWADRQGARRVA